MSHSQVCDMLNSLMNAFFLDFAIVSSYVVIGLLCLVGVGLSFLSFSGTWLVTLACLLAYFLGQMGNVSAPGLAAVIVFLVIAILIEGVEALASAWGVKRRGGSWLAGFAALIGGFLGLFFGSLIPIFIVGNVIGVLVGSFGLAFLAEYYRLKKSSHAAHIAIGAVLARIFMILVKGITTTVMAVWLMIMLKG